MVISCVGVINDVLIPCIVTTLTSPSCYQVSQLKYLFSILIFYSHSNILSIISRDCWSSQMIFHQLTLTKHVIFGIISQWSKKTCLSYRDVTMEVLKVTPPFTYSYQCGSTIRTSYIPVYMSNVSIQIIIDLFRVIIIFQTKYENIPSNSLTISSTW